MKIKLLGLANVLYTATSSSRIFLTFLPLKFWLDFKGSMKFPGTSGVLWNGGDWGWRRWSKWVWVTWCCRCLSNEGSQALSHTGAGDLPRTCLRKCCWRFSLGCSCLSPDPCGVLVSLNMAVSSCSRWCGVWACCLVQMLGAVVQNLLEWFEPFPCRTGTARSWISFLGVEFIVRHEIKHCGMAKPVF